MSEHQDPEFAARAKVFENELNALQVKHRVIIVPALQVNPAGINPVIQYVNKDLIDKKFGQTVEAGPIKG